MVETMGYPNPMEMCLNLLVQFMILKRFIPACILNKERQTYRRGMCRDKDPSVKRMGAAKPVCFLRDVAEAILHHHERWDGTGYPYGRKMEAIPVIARIVSVIRYL